MATVIDEIVDRQVSVRGIQAPNWQQRRLGVEVEMPLEANLVRFSGGEIKFYSAEGLSQGEERVRIGSKTYDVIPQGAKTIMYVGIGNPRSPSFSPGKPVFGYQ